MRVPPMLLLLCLLVSASLSSGQVLLHMNLSPTELPIRPLHRRELSQEYGVASHLLRSFSFFRPCQTLRIPLPKSVWGPSNPPEVWTVRHFGSARDPATSPKYPGSFAISPVSKHHRRAPRAVSPNPFPPFQGQDCDKYLCSDPLTPTPFGSPCGCVFPMKVVIVLGVASFRLFTWIPELEVEVAAGAFLKQSQVKIMGADASVRDQEKTTVTIYLVPLGEKFDKITALLIYDRFWQKKVPIDISVFGDYKVILVHYPGLPVSPTSTPAESLGLSPSGRGSQQNPITANVYSVVSPNTNSRNIALTVLSSFILVMVCLGVVFIILKWKMLGEPSSAIGHGISHSVVKRTGIRTIISNSMTSSTSASFVSTTATCPPSVKTFSLSEIEKATDWFSSKKLLGEGCFGLVYHGIMEDGSEIAVKLLREDHNKDRDFIVEVEMLSRLHHRNLVKLIGICTEGHIRCLVCELVSNGSLESHLHGSGRKKGILDWEARMKIALGAARGLAYLHEDSNPHVIHRDFKASNILLEEDFTPKVSDFGLAREASEGTHHVSNQVMGTFGYVAPEYAMTGHLRVKSDVYSYGVVLLELLSGRKPVHLYHPQGPENLVTWAQSLLTTREGLEQLIDPALSGSYDFDSVARVAAIAYMCVHVEPSQRPFMGEVVQALKLIYKDVDETCEDYCSQIESPSVSDSGHKGDFGHESNWWSRSRPHLTYGYASSFMTMDYSSERIEDVQRPHSTSSLLQRADSMARLNRQVHNGSKSAFYRLRGSMSEHGHFSRQPSSSSMLGFDL